MNWRGRFDASAVTSRASSACTSAVSSAYPSRASSPAPRHTFRFFDLPAELRLRIYEEVLLVDKPLDLGKPTRPIWPVASESPVLTVTC